MKLLNANLLMTGCLLALTASSAFADDRLVRWRNAAEQWSSGEVVFIMKERSPGEKPDVSNWRVALKYAGRNEASTKTPLDANFQVLPDYPVSEDVFLEDVATGIGHDPSDPKGAVGAAIDRRTHSTRSPIETFLRFETGSLLEALGSKPSVKTLAGGSERLFKELPGGRLLEVEFGSALTPDVVRVVYSGSSETVLEHRVLSRLKNGFPQEVAFRAYPRADSSHPVYECTLVVESVRFGPIAEATFNPVFPEGSRVGKDGKQYRVMPDGSWELILESPKAKQQRQNAPKGWVLILGSSLVGLVAATLIYRRFTHR